VTSTVDKKLAAPRPRTGRHGALTMGSGEASLLQSVPKPQVEAERTFPKPQYLVALDRANEVRFARAHEKRHIAEMTRADGIDRVIELLADPPVDIETLPIGLLLLWIPRVGAHRMRRWLRTLRVNELRPVGELTDRERARVVAAVRGERWVLQGWEASPA
jgi:hypothetical protein